MVIHLKFPSGKQKEFLILAKKKLNYSWDKIANQVGVHKQTLFVYLKEAVLISKINFQKLCLLAKFNEKDFIFEEVDIKNTCQTIKYPALSNDLANFIGLLAGDGYVSDKKPYEVSVVAHCVLDKYLIEEHTLNLIKTLFGLTPKLNYQLNVVKVRVYSKELRDFLIKNYNLPKGKKKGKLKIPQKIFNNKTYLRCYLRGLFDTDGSFHRHHKNTGCVEFISLDSQYLNQVSLALKSLNFKTSVSGKSLYIYDQAEIKRFFREIGTNNLKNKLKYERFINDGKVPLSGEIISIMRQ